MAILYKADGKQETVTPANSKKFTLKEMQGYVGGDIQMIQVPMEGRLIMNEEGRLKGLSLNEEGTRLGRLAGIAPDSFVVGDVLFCDNDEMS